MRATRKSVDRILALIVAALVGFGLLVFASAALGLLARGTVSVPSIVFNHLALGVGLGTLVLLVASRINYRVWRQWAPHLFIASLALTALVFIPGISFEAGGARRWIDIAGFSFQPSETLKMGIVFIMAAYFASVQGKITQWKYGIAAFLGILAVPAAIVLMQPDTGTFGIIAAAAGAIYLAAGARWRDIGILFVTGLIIIAGLALSRDYVMDRVMTFVNPDAAPSGEGYQIQQSLIAIGSGGFVGRGFGQSVQKFSYLPEPMTDSIFAVLGEEFGFIGTSLIVGLFMAFAARGYWIASHTPDYFGALLATGITTYLTVQAFLNIGAMLGMIPLTGIPLVFISHGGTAMMVALGSVGILLNISRYIKH